MKKFWGYLGVLILGVIIGCLIISYLNKGNTTVNDTQIIKLTNEKTVLKIKVDSLTNIINNKILIVTQLEKQLVLKDSDIIKINKKYEKINNSISKLGIDDQIKLFTKFLSKQDSNGTGYIDSDINISTEGL